MHVVGDDDDGIVGLELLHQLLNLEGGGTAWKKAAEKMRVSDRALFESAVHAGDIKAARRSYGSFLVNETQYLYSRFNRPAFANLPFVGSFYMFMSWPINFL